MRRNEITTELIELSERAKELGFPQDIEEGDWEAWDDGLANVTIHLIKTPNKLGDGEFLILSFSRCLEWLREKGYEVRLESRDIEYYKNRGWTAGVTVMKGNEFHVYHSAKTHHEAIAKAVVKILEEKK